MTPALQLAVVAVILSACQGGRDARPGDGGAAPARTDGGAAGARRVDGAPPVAPADAAAPLAPDPIFELGAIPAWQAVIDRAQYLARRGQRGVVYGLVGEAVPQAAVTGAGSGADAEPGLAFRWLVDDTEGAGALAIRASGLGRARPGARVALGGAWALDLTRRWYWKGEAMTELPAVPAPAPSDAPAPPGLVVGKGDPPAGARPVSQGKDDGVITFTVVGLARFPGDGWKIADELGDAPVAILTLPGERPSYGGHDLRQADERWTLRRGGRYWVRVGRFRRRSPDQPAQLAARGAPVQW